MANYAALGVSTVEVMPTGDPIAYTTDVMERIAPALRDLGLVPDWACHLLRNLDRGRPLSPGLLSARIRRRTATRGLDHLDGVSPGPCTGALRRTLVPNLGY